MRPRPVLPLLSAALLVLLAPSGVQAIQEKTPEPDWRYTLVLKPGGQLNLRSQPGLESPILGRLSVEAGEIQVTGLRQELDGRVWWQIAAPAAERGLAWVDSHYLTPSDPHQEREQDFPLHCLGTEPFWSLTLPGGEGEARFSRMAEEETAWQASAWKLAEGRFAEFAVRLAAEGEDAGEEEIGLAAIQRDYRFCYDNMSDFQYPYSLLVMTPADAVLSGCCRRAVETSD